MESTPGKDFASLMQGEAGADRRMAARLRPGQPVSGTVIQVGKDYVFVDVGGTVEGRIERRELEDAKGELKLQPGDKLQASVVDADDIAGPLLSVSFGRGRRRGFDTTALESAQRAQLPVEGVVGRAVKGGVEVSIGGVRAFCPASQLDTEFVQDLTRFEGQTLSFLVVEVKSEGRDVVVSRRALLEQEQARHAKDILAQLQVGGDYPATVSAIQKYGAFVDLGGGLEGLIHISELAHGRTDRVEDLLGIGESVTVRVLAIEPPEKRGGHPKLRLSLKALAGAPAAAAKPDPSEVLEGTVSKLIPGGVIVDTPKGSGLVPTRELGISRQADFRRVFPVGKAVTVVLINRDNSRGLTFSIARVASVQERANYSEFTRAMQGSPAAPHASFGSFGALLRQELNLPEPEPAAAPAAPEAPAVAAAPPAAVPAPVSPAPVTEQKVASTGAAPLSGAAPWRELVDKEVAPRPPQSAPRGTPAGVVRRQRPK